MPLKRLVIEMSNGLRHLLEDVEETVVGEVLSLLELLVVQHDPLVVVCSGVVSCVDLAPFSGISGQLVSYDGSDPGRELASRLGVLKKTVVPDTDSRLNNGQAGGHQGEVVGRIQETRVGSHRVRITGVLCSI